MPRRKEMRVGKNWKGTSMLLVGRSVTVIGLRYSIGEGAFFETFSSTRLGCR